MTGQLKQKTLTPTPPLFFAFARRRREKAKKRGGDFLSVLADQSSLAPTQDRGRREIQGTILANNYSSNIAVNTRFLTAWVNPVASKSVASFRIRQLFLRGALMVRNLL